MKKQTILFRTHLESNLALNRYNFLKATAGCPVTICFDTSSRPVGFSGEPLIEVGRVAYERLGLFSPADVSWRCGDYILYAATPTLKSFEYVWIIEFDVLLSFKSASDFLSIFDTVEADLLIADLCVAKPSWPWRNTCPPGCEPVLRSFFPVVRVSRRAIEHLYRERRAASEQWEQGDKAWPNDEVFVTNVLKRDGFSVLDLNASTRVYERWSFRANRPIPTALAPIRPMNRILHPVLSRDQDAARRLKTRSSGSTKEAVKTALRNAAHELDLARRGQFPRIGSTSDGRTH